MKQLSASFCRAHSLMALALLLAVPAQAAKPQGMQPKGQSATADGPLAVQYRRSTNLHVTLTGPAAILALRDELGLTDSQVRRLQEMLASQGQAATKQPPEDMAAKMAQMKKEMQTRPAGREAKMKHMMGTGGMPPMSKTMMLRCQVVMGLKLSAADPAVALAARKPLDLSDQQVERLEKIRDCARKEAERVLSTDQRKKLDEAVSAPTTFLDLYLDMLKDMQKMMAGLGK